MWYKQCRNITRKGGGREEGIENFNLKITRNEPKKGGGSIPIFD